MARYATTWPRRLPRSELGTPADCAHRRSVFRSEVGRWERGRRDLTGTRVQKRGIRSESG
jgi:hypothetical protein